MTQTLTIPARMPGLYAVVETFADGEQRLWGPYTDAADAASTVERLSASFSRSTFRVVEYVAKEPK